MDADRARAIYEEIDTYRITLVPNPPSSSYLNELIATCRNYLNAVARIIQELTRDRHHLATLLSAEDTAYRVEFDEILQGDVVIRNLPNIKDREAAINVRLRDRLARIAELKASMQSVEFVDKAVRLVHRELKGTMSEIRLQRSLLRDEIDTKSFYGDERETLTVNRFPHQQEQESSDDGLGADEITRLFREHEMEQQSQQAKPVLTLVSEPVPEPQGEDLMADAMTDKEYDDILSSL